MYTLTEKEQKELSKHFEERIPDLCILDGIIKTFDIDENKKKELLTTFSKLCNAGTVDMGCDKCCLEFFKLFK